MYNDHDIKSEREKDDDDGEGQRKWEGEMNEEECVLIKKNFFFSKTWKELEREETFFKELNRKEFKK